MHINDRLHVWDERYDTKLDAYENTALQSIRKYTIEQFRFWTESDFASHFRKMLTLEQYRNTEMAELYSQCIVAGPVAYLEDLFRELIRKGILKEGDPRQLAVEYYACFFFLSVCSIKQEKIRIMLKFSVIIRNILCRVMGWIRKKEQHEEGV